VKPPPSAIMPTARGLAADATTPIEAGDLGDQPVARDPLDELVDRLRPVIAAAVDAMQVAAVLEADGITDRGAQVRYGYPDVFALATEVHRRAGRGSTTAAVRRVSRRWAAELRHIGHGVLYLLPATVFPAVLTLLGDRPLILGLIIAGGLGWVWAGGANWVAFRLLGREHPGSAGRALRWAALSGPPLAAAVSVGVVAATGAGYGLVPLAAGQMAYQMASSVLVFYRRELWLFAAMLPAAVAGGWYSLAAGPSTYAVGVGAAAVAVVFGLAVWQTTGRSGIAAEPTLRDGLRGELGAFPVVLLYAALSAGYLLHAQARYVQTRVDIAVAIVPLMLGMGVVEWRAQRFVDQARLLLRRVRYPREFVPRIRLLLVGGFLTCVTAIGVLAAGLLVLLRDTGVLTPAGVLMAATGVLLGGAYFLGFLLANMDRYRWLCGALALCLGLHVAARHVAVTPLADTLVLLASAVLLVLLHLYALSGRLGEARYHR
jgi:hypothetical protein